MLRKEEQRMESKLYMQKHADEEQKMWLRKHELSTGPTSEGFSVSVTCSLGLSSLSLLFFVLASDDIIPENYMVSSTDYISSEYGRG